MQGSTREELIYAERHVKESNQYLRCICFFAYINNAVNNTYIYIIYIYAKLYMSCIIWVARWLQAIYDIISFD